jgi:hypothetical protein
MRHGRDMPENAILENASGSLVRTFADLLVKAGLPIMEDLVRQYERGVRLRALRTERRRASLRTADLQRLLTLPGWPPLVRRRLERLLSDKWRLRGRPVLQPPPRISGKAVIDALSFCKALWSPTTSAKERRELYRKTFLYPCFIESTYRGELSKAQRKLGRRAGVDPHQIAEEEVAAAAEISPRQVREICNKQREKFRRLQPNVVHDPEMDAAELKRHLEMGPSL